jgi:hypothetical protein
MAQELIGLSHFKALDEARSSALKHHLQTCANCQRFSGRCEAGVQVASVLKEVMPSQSLIAFVGQDHSFAKNVAKKYSWKNWPMGLRWASELMALAVVLVIVVEIFPWRKVINRLESPGAHPVNGVAAVAVAESPTQEPEMKGDVVQTKYPSPSPEAKPTPAPKVALAKTDLKAAAESMEGEAEAMPTPTKVQKVTQGSLFRADMTVTKPLGETDTVRIAIEGLGGEKAVHPGLLT